ncbi:MAG: hypothetical protein V2A79_07920 [Planctomycetota bacterium]
MFTVLVGALVLWVGFVDSGPTGATASVEALPVDASAQSTPAAPESSPSPQTRRVSDLLPGVLAEYVRAYGLDHSTGDLSKEALKQVENQMVSYEVALELLCPQVFHRVDGPVVFQRTDADARLVAATYVTVNVDGQTYEIPMGEEVPRGVEVVDGLVLNVGPGSAFWLTSDGVELQLGPGEVMANPSCPKSCAMTGCPAGERACCYSDTKGCARCTCVPGSPGTCPDGTTGGTGCSVTAMEAGPVWAE